MKVIKINRKIIAGASIVVVGLALGILIGVFLLPNVIGNNGSLDSDYARIKVFSGSSTHRTFDDSAFTFLYKREGEVSDPENCIEIIVQGSSEILPTITGRTYDILGINVVVSEVYDDYVVLLVKPS